MKYQIKPLSPNLVYIRWTGLPNSNTYAEQAFIEELRAMMDAAEHPLYFISDLRQGRIIDIDILRELGTLTRHKNWAGSTAFSRNPMSNIFVNTFVKLSRYENDHHEIWDTPEEALSYLESIQAGLTDNINWSAILRL